MKAALFEKPHHLRVVQKPTRTIDEHEVLIRVSACGVCGTDVHIVEGSSRSSPPVVLGHEFTGVIEDMKAPVGGFSVGDRVAVDPNVNCGRCFFCRRGEVHLCERLRALGVDLDGGMAEFCIVPPAQLYRLPGTMAPDVAAFIEPLSCAVHGIDRAAIRAGDTVVILGGGTAGLLLAQLAKNAGAAHTVVVEPVEWKRKIAERVGADVVIDPEATDVRTSINELTSVGADVVIECVGKPRTVALALDLARRGGTVEIFGVCPLGETVPLEPNCVYSKEITIVGSYINPHTFDRAIALLAANKVTVGPFVINKFPLDRVREALNALQDGTTIKSLICPSL